MDTAQAITHIGLCAGYGGIELGLGRVIPNLRSVAFCEIEAFAVANLVAKMEAGLMDPAPVWPDLKTFPWGAFRDRVDILTGGYPCQPFSAAGKRAGKDDPRHLWPYIADGIRLLQPKLCFFENVEGHISLGLSDVIEDLAGMGYRTTWGIFSAAEVGAPHQRKRVFILAHLVGTGLEGMLHDVAAQGREDAGRPIAGRREHRGDVWPSRPGEHQFGWEPPRVVGGGDTGWQLDDPGSDGHGADDAVPAGREGAVHASDVEDSKCGRGEDAEPQHASVPSESGGCYAEAVADGLRLDRRAPAEGREYDRQAGSAGEELGDAKDGTRLRDAQRSAGHVAQSDEVQHILDSVWKAQPPMGGDTDGSSRRLDHAELYVSCDNRTDELRLLGNGVVPATAELAFRVLIMELLQPSRNFPLDATQLPMQQFDLL